MRIRLALLFLFLTMILSGTVAQSVSLSGCVIDDRTGKAIEYASVLLPESGLWAVTNAKGRFVVQNVPRGKVSVTVQCLGYAKATLFINIADGTHDVVVRLKEDNLLLDEVTVVARRKDDVSTTSYTIDRSTLDNQQLLSLGEITTLLPGGKTQNGTLMSDTRLSLRSEANEKGNASFGTAIEVDGVRIDNNAQTDETQSASTRTLSSANIESVEVVTGIPSVEYGDLSNGVVKVNTRKGKSPFIVEGKLNQHTRQVAVSKGFDLGERAGMLNVSAEHARSFTNIASPYTSYQRNVLTVNFMNVFMRDRMPLTLTLGATGNVGGYNSEADPDEMLDDYVKVRDNNLRAHFEVNWLLNRPWLTSLQLRGAFSVADKLTEQYSSRTSASTQPCLHTLTEKYAMAQDYDTHPQADIILSPTGYWYTRSYNDAKPTTYSLKLKAEWNHPLRRSKAGRDAGRNHLMAGAELTGSHNNGRGTYYDDLRFAPTWRAYRYNLLPWMRNVAFYAEDRLTVPYGQRASLELTAGLRTDITLISGSDYGTVGSLSPRFSGRYVFWHDRKHVAVSDLSLHAGWGKSVKLPSFQVLYPAPSYADRLAFSSQSTADNRSYYAYHTYPTKALYNPGLRWQYTNQTDIGIEVTLAHTHITLSAFEHRTYRSYMSVSEYTPFTYKYTPPSSLEACAIPIQQRAYSIDPQTGIVTVTDAQTGRSETLAYNERHTYTVGSRYVNATPVVRRGIEWTVDFPRIRSLRTQLRLDGKYYYYKGIDDVLFADIPLGVSSTMSGGRLYQYVGYYRGSNVTSATYGASAAIANGSLTKQAHLNATVTTHVPRIRLIVALRLECSLYNYNRRLSELPGATRGIVLDEATNLDGQPYDGSSRDHHVALYPEYYATWDTPGELIPFAEKFRWARDNDPTLYSDLSKLVIRTNYPYVMNPSRIDSYCSANVSVTKEIGDHVSLSFYANNFVNSMKRVGNSQTGSETTLFHSSYIPSFYYGLSLRLKI